MKKWILTLVTAFFLTTVLVGMGATTKVLAATEKTGTTSDGFSYKIKDGAVEITGYSEKKKKLVIPDKIDGKKVKKIGKKVFSQNKYIVSIKIPDSVENIAKDAFYKCEKLETIELGKNVKEIGEVETKAYDDLLKCDDLEMYIGESFKAFKVDTENKVYFSEEGVLFKRLNGKSMLINYPDGKKTKKYTIPDGVAYINLTAFEFSNISTLVIPKSIEDITTSESWPDWVPMGKIEEYVVDEANEIFFSEEGVLFRRNEGETVLNKEEGSILMQYPAEKKNVSYMVPEGVVSISSGAFMCQKYLENVTIPSTVYYVGEMAFEAVENLKSADIGAKVLRDQVFYDCKKLVNVNLQNTVVIIGEEAFMGIGATSLVLPESVQYAEDMWSVSLKKLEVRNPNCELIGTCSYVNQLVVYGYEGSTAEVYAKKYGYRFKLIGEEEKPGEGLSEGTINRDTVQLSKTSYTYNGKAKKPEVILKDKFGNIIKKENYKVTYKNNKNVGLATVKIQLAYPYTGTIKTTFSIKPPVSSITKTEKTENGFRVQWKGVKASQIDGYEIQYSTDKKFKKESSKRVFVNQSNVVKKNIKAADTENKYYVRIRSYKVVSKDGKTERLYSKWSEKKTVKNL